MVTTMASESRMLTDNGADSPRARIERGLESIGGMTTETLQRISTAVGGVVKSPVVLMAKVGGLASPRAAPLTAPPDISLAERMHHLENQTRSLEEKFRPMTIVTESELSMHKENLQIGKSLLQEMEMDRTLEERVQMLEDCVNERLKRFEKALLSIQSRLDYLELCWQGNVVEDEHQESLSCEPQYYDGKQQGDNFEALAIAKQKSFARNPILEKSHLKETSFVAPATTKHIEPLQEIDTQMDDFLEPQVVSTPVYSKEAFLTQPMESIAPSSEPREFAYRDDVCNLPTSLDQQLASTMEELYKSFATQSMATTASAKFLEIARAVTIEKSTLACASSMVESPFALKEPQEVFSKEPVIVVPIAKSKEYVQEDNTSKNGTIIGTTKSPSPKTFEATSKDFTKESITTTSNIKCVQDLATKDFVIIPFASSEPLVTSKSREELSVVIPIANFEEVVEEETSDKSDTITIARQLLKALSSKNMQDDFVNESSIVGPSARLSNDPSLQIDLTTTSDTTLASSKSPLASKSIEAPLPTILSANIGEPTLDDFGKNTSDITLPSSESSKVSKSIEESSTIILGDNIEEHVKEDIDKNANDSTYASFESPMASKSIEEPLSTTLGANIGEPVQEDIGKNTRGTTHASSKSPMEFQSKEEPSTVAVGANTRETTQEDFSRRTSDTTLASSESPMASKSIEEPSRQALYTKIEKPTQEDIDRSTSDTTLASSKSLVVSKSIDESSATTLGISIGEPTEEVFPRSISDTTLASSKSPMISKSIEKPSTTALRANTAKSVQEDFGRNTSDTTLASSESQVASKSIEEPSATTLSTNIEKPAQEDIRKSTSDTTLASMESLVAFKSIEEPSTLVLGANIGEPTQEDFGTTLASSKSSMASNYIEEPSIATLNTNIKEPAQKEIGKSTSDTTLASSESRVESKSMEEPSTATSSANIGEPAQADFGRNTSDTTLASLESPVASKSKEEPSTTTQSINIGEPTQEDFGRNTSDTILASSESRVESKFMEEPSIVTLSDNIGEPAQEDFGRNTSDTTLASLESLVASKSKEEPSAATLGANIGKPPPQEDIDKSTSDTTLASFKSSLASKSTEEPSRVALNVNIGESIQEDFGRNTSDTTLASLESPIASRSREEPSATTLGASIERPAQEDIGKSTSDTTHASSESLMASQSKKELSIDALSTNIEESVQKDIGRNTSNTIHASSESLVASKSRKEASATTLGANIGKPPQEDFDKSTSDTTLTSSESHVASKSIEELSTTTLSINIGESTQEDFGRSTSDTRFASSKSPMASKSIEEPSISALDANIEELVQKDLCRNTSDTTRASSKSLVAFKSTEEPSLVSLGANIRETTQKDVGKNTSDITLASSESPVASKSTKEPSAATLGNSIGEPIQEDFDRSTSNRILASSKSKEISTFVEEPLAPILSLDSEEPIYKDVAKKNTIVNTTREDPQEDFEEKTLVAPPNARLVDEVLLQEDLDATNNVAFASSTPFLASKLVEKPLPAISKANSKELVHSKDGVKSNTISVGADLLMASSFEESQEDFEKESLASTSSHELVQRLTSEEDNHIVPISTQSQELSKSFEEDNRTAKEVEYKLAEDFKVHHEHTKSIEKEFPKIQSDLVYVGANKSLARGDTDDCLESDESSEEFFDVEHGSGNFEPWKFDESKSFEEFGEVTGMNVAAKKETSVLPSSVESRQKCEQKLEQKPDQAPIQELEQHDEITQQAYVQAPRQEFEEEFEQQSIQEPIQELEYKSEQQCEQQLLEEPKQEDFSRNSAIALPPLEPQVTSKSRESHQLLAKEPLEIVPSIKFEEPTQSNAIDESGTHDLLLTSTAKEPQLDIAMTPEKNLLSAFFHQSDKVEVLENLKQKSSNALVTSSTPQEALERETLTTAPAIEIAQGHDVEKSDDMHILLKPQLEESKETLANEALKAIPSSEYVEPAQEVSDGQFGAILASPELQLTPSLEELQEGFVKKPLADEALASKFVDLKESLANEPSKITSAKLAQENIADKISVRLVEESPMTPIVEEPQDGNVSTLGEVKYGQDKANQMFLEDVKIIPKPIEEAIPKTQSDLPHVKLNPTEATKDSTTKLQSQGSFLAFGATWVDSKEASKKEPLPSAKLLELYEEDNNYSRERENLMQADPPMTSTVQEEPQNPLIVKPKPLLESSKLVPKGHASRRRGFPRSLSEPEFAYKLEEHQKTLAKVSSVAASTLPSASKLGEDYTQEDFDDAQYLPFKFVRESKRLPKESELKLVEDVKNPKMKSETISFSPYVLEPKPSKIKEKKKEKKEKKERKPSAVVEEKEKRFSLRLGKMERKSSLVVEEKDGKYSLQAEEKHKQPFKHLRDRLRHAFSINKEP